MSRLLVLSLFVGAFLFGRPSVAERPNVVLIMADDMGYGDCGAFNSAGRIKTPHIDQLAREGLCFLDAHAAGSTCTPSRYGLLTGVNPARKAVANTLLRQGRPIIADDEPTLPGYLQSQGYVTRMVGKWHLGFEMAMQRKQPRFDFTQPVKGGPLDRGFDSWFGLHSSPGADPLCLFSGRRVVQVPSTTLTYTKIHRGQEVSVKVDAAEGYRLEEVSPTLCRKAVEIISQHRTTGDGQPLFLYYASPLPHQPWTPADAFAGRSGLGLYADVVMQLDEVVGQMMAALEPAGLAENTLVIFTSDNGPGPDAVRQMQAVDHASAGAWRGKKAESWEGGHRVPFIVRWPGKVSAGEVTNATINFTDIFPTLVELTGGDPAKVLPLSKHDAGQSEQQLSVDGTSFLSVLRAPASAWRRPPMVHGQHGVREKQWKLVSPARGTDALEVPDKSFGLYDIQNDPAEREDRTTDFPEEAARLRAYYRQFAKQRTPKK